ncbi:MAG: hypothetical protein J5590_08975 [Clostridia bacterium]|nr:hypothetical protein [Clostridia bacterium]
MLKLLKGFLKEEEGMGTVEIVVIIAVLVSIALIFRNAITNWVRDTIQSIFGSTDTSIETS